MLKRNFDAGERIVSSLGYRLRGRQPTERERERHTPLNHRDDHHDNNHDNRRSDIHPIPQF